MRKLCNFAFFALGLCVLTLTGCYHHRSDESNCAMQPSVQTHTVVSNCPDDFHYNIMEDDLYILEKRSPSRVSLGQEYEYRYTLTPRVFAKNIVVDEMLPEGSTYVGSDPEAIVDGNRVVWQIDQGRANMPLELSLRVVANELGQLCNCTSVSMEPVLCSTVCVGRPALRVTKVGPAEVCGVCENVAFDITVENTGTHPAHEVVLIDTVPSGLEHATGKSELSLDLGTIEPGEMREAQIVLRTTRRGEFCNHVKVVSCDADEAEDEACIRVVEPGLALEKTGPRCATMGETAVYRIEVRNVGDMNLEEVLVSDTFPYGTTLVDADDGRVDGQDIHWVIPHLDKGESKVFEITLQGCTCGELCNEAVASLCDGDLLVHASACTQWNGRPDLVLEAVDTCDPLLTCESTEYIIRVTNQGTAVDENITIHADFSEHLEPVRAAGPVKHDMNGNSVMFGTLPSLAPGEVVEYRIMARAAKAGDAFLKVRLNSDTVKMMEEMESTQVYQ